MRSYLMVIIGIIVIAFIIKGLSILWEILKGKIIVRLVNTFYKENYKTPKEYTNRTIILLYKLDRLGYFKTKSISFYDLRTRSEIVLLDLNTSLAFIQDLLSECYGKVTLYAINYNDNNEKYDIRLIIH